MTAMVQQPAGDKAVPGLMAVLFLEDNENDFELARIHLEKLKLQNPVYRVRNADDLMAYLHGAREYHNRSKYPFPAVIVIDQRLPKTSGLDVQALLRASLKFRTIPIIAISSPERIAALQSAVKLGADGYLTKPFQAGEFARHSLNLKLPLQFAQAAD